MHLKSLCKILAKFENIKSKYPFIPQCVLHAALHFHMRFSPFPGTCRGAILLFFLHVVFCTNLFYHALCRIVLEKVGLALYFLHRKPAYIRIMPQCELLQLTHLFFFNGPIVGMRWKCACTSSVDGL